MTTLPELMRPQKLPKKEVVERMVEGVDLLLPKMASDHGRQQLREALRRAIRQGTLSRMAVIKAADDGFAEADRALREEWIEMEEHHEQVPDSLKDYMKRRANAGFSATPKGRGNELLDDFSRNIAICALVSATRKYFHQTRAMAFEIVSEALGRRHINLTPRRVQNIYNALGGLAARLDALIPSEA